MDARACFALQDNRRAVLRLTQRVVHDTALEEEGLCLGYLEPLLDLAVDGEFLVIEATDHAGGFGTVDLVAVVVVPLLAARVRCALAATGLASVVQLRAAPQPCWPAGGVVTADDVRELARRCRSRRAARLAERIAAAVNAALLELARPDGNSACPEGGPEE